MAAITTIAIAAIVNQILPLLRPHGSPLFPTN